MAPNENRIQESNQAFCFLVSNNIQQASNFLIDCNQLPPSSDIQGECLPIVQMQLDK